ncbi:ORF6N domain-containing protein [Pectobacterium brasiliense]|uniref:ORF6N domain-containing protein n=1 Tax=Pectobacterium TaxID=122277 RepID=UPI00202D5F89|nr:ORF6N domain-containing protein [Pectobacterium carotovorum]MCL6332013.1 ORF6N domain-containing protein [Pectobacterium carotovorum subsp. carotovorum]
MTTQLSVESLSVVTHNNTPVVTTELLAQLYGTTAHSITKNHRSNVSRFVCGKHYYKITGKELVDLRVTYSDLQISAKTRSLILWTERGAARHAKMLETDQAWDVFEKLEECYFNPQAKAVQPLPQKPVHPCELEFYIPETPLIFNHIQTSQLNALFKSVEYLTMDFWPHMQALFPTLDCKHGSAVNTVNLLMRLLKDKRAEADELSKQD